MKERSKVSRQRGARDFQPEEGCVQRCRCTQSTCAQGCMQSRKAYVPWGACKAALCTHAQGCVQSRKAHVLRELPEAGMAESPTAGGLKAEVRLEQDKGQPTRA